MKIVNLCVALIVFVTLFGVGCYNHPGLFAEVVQVSKTCRKVYVQREFYNKRRDKWQTKKHTVTECKHCKKTGGCVWKAE